jgi:hypothetical protein
MATATDFKKEYEELEKILEEERTQWNRIVGRLAGQIKDDLKKSMYLEAEAISRLQELTELIANYSYDVNKIFPVIKKMKKKRWEFYTSKYQLGAKMSGTEKKMMTEADLSYLEGQVDAYKNHINFFIEAKKAVSHIIWSVKNKIQLYNITEMNG